MEDKASEAFWDKMLRCLQMSWCHTVLIVALPANVTLMNTLYIVPTAASGTQHSVCEGKGVGKKEKKDPLPADAIKANVIQSWCNPGCNNLHILSKTSYSAINKSCLVASSKGGNTTQDWCNGSVWITVETMSQSPGQRFKKKKKRIFIDPCPDCIIRNKH